MNAKWENKESKILCCVIIVDKGYKDRFLSVITQNIGQCTGYQQESRSASSSSHAVSKG